MTAHGRVLVLVATLLVASGATPPEPPAGPGIDGDVVAGAEAAGVDAGEWDALFRGSATSGSGTPGLQALLESPNVDHVVFYKNLDRSATANADDAYHVYARRCRNRSVLVEDCPAQDIVFDHLVYTRSATTDGRYAFDVVALTAENPVGTVLGAVTPENPFGSPSVPGPVTLADRDDPRRDPRALATLTDEQNAATQSVLEIDPATEQGVERHFLPPENTTYPYPYERLAAVFDDSDAPDLFYVPTPSGDGPRGGHGSDDVTQSRTTFLISGRAARRTPLSASEEAALEIHNVDIAPTIARALGIPPHAAARLLNGGDVAANPAGPDALLRRQDGKPLDALLEKRLNTFVVVIDGLIFQDITPSQMPNLCALTACSGATPDPTANVTTYQQARSIMVAQTNANHAAMVTGAYADTHGIVGNSFLDRSTGTVISTDDPALIRVDTLFDVFRSELPHMTTAAVMGKEKLRQMFDCTQDGSGNCIAGSTDNPEGQPVTHVRPDFLRGAAESPEPGSDDCQAETASGSGIATDACIMELAIQLSATEDPDFTFINLGTVDGVQHVSGPNGAAADVAIAAADVEIGRLVQYLKDSGKWERSVVIVTADHQFSYQGAAPAQLIDLQGPLSTCGVPFQVVSNGGVAHVYLDSVGMNATSWTPAEQAALKCMRLAVFTLPGVSDTLYRFQNPLDLNRSLDFVRPNWHVEDQRMGDLIVTALASGPNTGTNNPNGLGSNSFESSFGPGYSFADLGSASSLLPGDHGHPATRHIPFYVMSGGSFVKDQIIFQAVQVNEADDTGPNPNQAESVDVAPTIAWMYGLEPTSVLPAAEGRVLNEAFHTRPIDAVEPHANRAVVFIFDGNNSVRMHELMADCDDVSCNIPENVPVAAVRSLVARDSDARSDLQTGILTRYGAISAHPTVTFPNHNTVGSGVLPGHHGIVGNRYYERDVETEQDPIDPTDPRNPSYFFTSELLREDFETLHEAVHRAFGRWQPAPDPLCDPQLGPCDGPTGAFTASVNEPSARGANFASLETVSSNNLPALFAALVANPEFADDTDLACAQQDPDAYGQESVLDHLGQAQARSLYADDSTLSLPRPPEADPLLADTSGGAAHPDPKYMIENFTLTDGAGHDYGPHGNCTRSGYGDTSSRLGRVLAELRNNERFATTGEPARAGETLIVLTGDHGMENQDQAPGRNGGFDTGLTGADIEYVRQGTFLYLLTLDVEIAGLPAGGLKAGVAVTLTLTVTDDDVRADGTRTPVEGALVTIASGPDTAPGFTDANGQVILSFIPYAGGAQVTVDRDGNPASGGRTLGSTANDPFTHGQVQKVDFNDRVIQLTVSP